MADKTNEDDWEYESEDGEDYEWEYSEEEAEPVEEVANSTTSKPANDKSDDVVKHSQTHKEKQDEEEEDEDEEEEEEELELEDIDLPDPFSAEPTPKVADVKVNGSSEKNGTSEGKRSKKHKSKKSKHHDKFEKFRRLEEGETKGEEHRSRKIHVRSKDPSKIARQFEKESKEKDRGPRHRKGAAPGKETPKPKPIEINKICKICGKEPYLVERLVAEKSWWCKNCFRCNTCNKILSLDTYASHQGVIYCKPHHKELFQPKPVVTDLTEEIIKKNLDFCQDDPIERHRNQERRMETIVRENRPVQLEGVVKSKVDDSKWEGLEKLDVGSKFLMFEKSNGEEEREPRSGSDRYGIMEKLKRLQAGEAVEDLLAEIDEEMPSMSEDEEEEDEETAGLTQVQKKAHNAEKLFVEESRKEKLMLQRKKELKGLRDRLMAGTRDSILDQFDELNHKKIKKTQVDVRGQNAKKFMDMFNKGEIPEGISATDRITLEKEAELDMMRSKKRDERNFFHKMENGEIATKDEPKPKLLVGKLKEQPRGENLEGGDVDVDAAPLAKKFSFFENYEDSNNNEKGEPDKTNERQHAARDCKARSVLNKFKDMERKVANGEEVDDPLLVHKRPLKRFTPPRKLGGESDSEYSSSEYSDSEYSSSYSSYSTDDEEEDEYLRNIREAARAKQLMAKFEDWEAKVGEDGGYTNLVDENGLPLETASKLKNKFEQLAVEETEERPSPTKPKFQVRRFKPKEAYEYQLP